MGKTKTFGALFAVLSCLQGFGVIHLTPDQLQALQALCTGGIVWGLRDAIGKNGSNL